MRSNERMSKVLILAICSNHKIKTESPCAYSSERGVSAHLLEPLRSRFFEARRHVRVLITSDRVSRDGKLLREMPFNADLIDGPDLGGLGQAGLYMPALQRYDGRFYRELGTTVAQRDDLAAHMRHHLLILSGLYGLLLPGELIQCYSCHLPDHPDIAKYWIKKTKTDLLTELLIAYIERNDITRVFDFMAVDCYRNLISWEMVRNEIHGAVFHCYSEQFTGAALLPSLGYLARDFLAAQNEESLCAIKPRQSVNIPNDEITFLPFPMPEPPLAREIHEQEAVIGIADQIGRMRRNLLRILAGLSSSPNAGFGDLVRTLRMRRRSRDLEISRILNRFAEIRNRVEYRNHVPSVEETDKIWQIYYRVLGWARENVQMHDIVLEPVDDR